MNLTETIAYLTECTLATVDRLALKSKPSKSELRRQISIAQVGLDTLRQIMDFSYSKYPRVNDLLSGEFKGMTVAKYAMEVRGEIQPKIEL